MDARPDRKSQKAQVSKLLRSGGRRVRVIEHQSDADLALRRAAAVVSLNSLQPAASKNGNGKSRF
jgi:hypothetical protein